MDDTSAPAPPPGRITRIIAACAMAALGLVMMLHGTGVVSAAWLNPNPLTPSWVFVLIGLILALAACLAAIASPAPGRAANILGWSVLVLMLAAAHWLVFLAQGASCSIETGSMDFGAPGLVCTVTMGGALIVIDLILLAAAIAWFRKPPKTERPATD
jgi:hypothetical protein